MKKAIIIVVILAVAAIIAVPRALEMQQNTGTEIEARPLAVEGRAVTRTDLAVYANVPGSVEASASVPVMVPVPAKAVEVLAAVGDRVEKDDVLFILDGEDVEDQVAQSQLAVEQAQAGLSQAAAGIESARQGQGNAGLSYEMAVSNYNMNLANYEFAVKNLASYKVLFDEGIISEAEYDQMALQASPETKNLLDRQLEQAAAGKDQAALGLTQAQAVYRQAQAGLKQAQLGLDNARELLADLEVKAPASGYVAQLAVEKDVIVSNAQPAAMIESMDTVRVVVSATPELVGRIRKGDTAQVRFPALDASYEGVVETVAVSADARTLLYPVKLLVENTEGAIRPGMFATVDILSESAENVMAVPVEAIITQGGQASVLVQAGESSVEERSIETGLDAGSMVQVLSGLEEGDVVIVKGAGLINEDTELDIIRGDR